MADRDEKGRFKASKPKAKGKATPLDVKPRAPLFKSVYETQRSVIRLTANVLINSDIAYRRDYTLQRMMRHDPDVMGPLMQRQMAVALLDWNLVPDDPDDKEGEELAALMTRGIKRMRRWHDFLRHLQEAVWYGPSGANVIYAMTGDDELPIIPHNWRPYHPDSITFTDVGDPALRVSHHYEGETVPTENGRARILTEEERAASVMHVFMPQGADFRDIYESRYIYAGRGLRDIVWFQWLLKQTALQLWSTYVERYSMGTRIGRYPHGDPAGQAAMEEILQNMIADVTVLLPRVADDPDAFSIEIAEPNAQASSIYSELIGGYLGGAIKELIIGQSATTEATATGLGSSVGDQHAETFNRIIKFDAGALEDTLTEQLVGVYQRMIAPDSTSRIRFEFALDDVDPEAFMAGAEKAWQMGVAIPTRQIRQRLGLDDPEPGEDVVQQDPAAAGGPGGPGGGDPFGGLFGDGPEGPEGGPDDGGPDGPGGGEKPPKEEPPPGSDAFARAREWLKEQHQFDESKINRDGDGKFAPKGAGDAGGGEDGSDPTGTRTDKEGDSVLLPAGTEAIAAGLARSSVKTSAIGEKTGWDFDEQKEALQAARAKLTGEMMTAFDLEKTIADATRTGDGILPSMQAHVRLDVSLARTMPDPAIYIPNGATNKAIADAFVETFAKKGVADLPEAAKSFEKRLNVILKEHDASVAGGRGGFTTDGIYHDPDPSRVEDCFRAWNCDYDLVTVEGLKDADGNPREMDPRVGMTAARRLASSYAFYQKAANELGLTAGAMIPPLVLGIEPIRGNERATAYYSRGIRGVSMSLSSLDKADVSWRDGKIEDGASPEAFDGPKRENHGLDPFRGGMAVGTLFSHEFAHAVHQNLIEAAIATRTHHGTEGNSAEAAAAGKLADTLAGFYGQGIGGKGFYDSTRARGYWWGKLKEAGYVIPKGVSMVKLTDSLFDEIGEYGARYPWEFIAEAHALQQEGGTLGKASALIWKNLGLPEVTPAVVGTDRAGIPAGEERKRGRASRTKFSALDQLLNDGQAVTKARETRYSWKDRVDPSPAYRESAKKHVTIGKNMPARVADAIASGTYFSARAIGQGINRAKADGMKAPILFTDGGDGPSIEYSIGSLTANYDPRLWQERNVGLKDDLGTAGVYAIPLDGTGGRLTVSTDGRVVLTPFAPRMRDMYEKKLQGRLLGHEQEAERFGGTISSMQDGYGMMHAGDAMAAVVSSSSDQARKAREAHVRLMRGTQDSQETRKANAVKEWDNLAGKDSHQTYADWSRQGKGFETSDPIGAMAGVYAYAKMQGFVPTKIRKLYQRIMGPDAPPIPKWDPKR